MDGCVLRSLFPKEVVECHFGLDAGGVGVAPDAIGGYERNVAVPLASLDPLCVRRLPLIEPYVQFSRIRLSVWDWFHQFRSPSPLGSVSH